MAKDDQNPEEAEIKRQQVAASDLQEQHKAGAAAVQDAEGFFVHPETQQPQFDGLLTQDDQGLTDLHNIMKENNPEQDILPEDFVQYTVAGQLKNMPEKKSVGTVKPGDRGAVA